MRPILTEAEIETKAQQVIANFHLDVVQSVQKAVESNEWVVIGMGQNQFVKEARQYLDKKGIKFHYVEHGSYFSKWQERLAIKMWSGWPTFPQIFHKGQLIGGFKDLKIHLS